MPTVAFRVTRARRGLLDAPKVRQVLEAVLDGEVKPHFIKQFEAVTNNWQNAPDFQARKFITPDAIAVNVFPTGAGKKIYTFVTAGTRPHIITPKRAKFLAFVWGGPGSYKPKTTPGGGYGGPGVVVGGVPTARNFVRHPGNAPRNFEAMIRKREAPWFSRTMNNAWRRAIRAMGS